MSPRREAWARSGQTCCIHDWQLPGWQHIGAHGVSDAVRQSEVREEGVREGGEVAPHQGGEAHLRGRGRERAGEGQMRGGLMGDEWEPHKRVQTLHGDCEKRGDCATEASVVLVMNHAGQWLKKSHPTAHGLQAW